MNLNLRKNQIQQPFETEKEKLLGALNKINTDALTLEQIAFLKEIGVLDILGKSGVAQIKSIFLDNRLDMATATKKIGEFSTRIGTAVQKLQEINETLSKSFSVEENDEISEDSVLMRVYFQQNVAIKNVVDFKKFAAIWYDIGRGIAISQNESPEDFKIIGAKKGSIIIEMAILASLATSVSVILLRALRVAERGIEILQKAEGLKNLKLNNKKIEQELRKEAESEKKKGIQLILDTSVEELGLDSGAQGDKITALKKAITNLIEFTQKGGAVDFIEPEIEEEKEEGNSNPVREEILKLRKNIEEIRFLENKIKLLESKVEE